MKILSNISGIIILGVFSIITVACNDDENNNDNTVEKQLEVSASAYNSLKGQTVGNPSIAAWGDTLKPGMKVIAVSRDLIDSGLVYGTKVKIKGFSGEYTVRDKMHYRMKNKIDIYMGTSRKDALEWGIRKVNISWEIEKIE